MRSMQAGGLINVHNFPILMESEERNNEFQERTSRNNIVLASAKPLDPTANAAGWQRLKQFCTVR